ncbi:MAG: acetylornithine/succinyldiaminopimelate transaminase [Casimicrobiaceae bacterium]|nr:acetylornithine/succinyldiaminopimelate transaminase [Casimicrobiaceae bacterium]MCX8098717.1 acetylornithine/succinyldiaminopimelate transaminase [Casimicrobiaceae bacterium]MDW8312156.1 acetylornithine/succinyldiaminopimelate transaminase [Burkholderiales bacterium]
MSNPSRHASAVAACTLAEQAPAATPRVSRETFERVMFPTYAPAQFVPVRGEGSRVWDRKGRDYIDLAGGVAVLSLGHCHPALVAALKAQAERLWHVSNYMVNEPALELAAKLVEKTFADRVFLCNSGAEANEGALKTARKWAITHFGERKHRIVSTLNSFHGRTWLAVATGGQAKYVKDMGPVPPGITHVPYNDVDALARAMDDEVACVILEPMQGEGGMYPGTPEFLGAARELCDRHRALLIFDEIQSGVGRTGALYSYMRKGVTPDLLTSAKGLGGGFPIGCFMARAEVAEVMQPGSHGTTYGGNPLGAAVANAVLDIVDDPAFLARVLEAEARLRAGFAAINERYRVFSEVRGEGLWLGCELVPAFKNRAGDFMKAGHEHGVIFLTAGNNDVLRFAPALNITDAEIDEGLARLERAVAALSTPS